jgi:hypothetical protein
VVVEFYFLAFILLQPIQGPAMGAKHSSRQERQVKSTKKNELVAEAIRRIEEQQQERTRHAQQIDHHQPDKAPDDDVVMVVHSQQKQNEIKTGAVVSNLATSAISEIQVEQLHRGGAAFTKPDLVALAISINGGRGDPFSIYRTMTCDDLRTAIRVLLYAPPTAPNESLLMIK